MPQEGKHRLIGYGLAIGHAALLDITPFGRTFQPQPRYQGLARWAIEAYVPRLITSPSS
jgi:hypothetical protein